MPLRVDNIKAHIVERLTDGDILDFLIHQIGRGEDGTLCRSVAVVEMETSRRCQRGQFLSTRRQMQQGMVLDVCGKLISHLCRHERMGDLFALEIIVQGHEVETQLFRNDIDGSTAGQGRIHVHHASIKAIAGICCNFMSWFQSIIALVPMAEANKILVSQLTAFGNARRARGVKQDEEAGGSY